MSTVAAHGEATQGGRQKLRALKHPPPQILTKNGAGCSLGRQRGESDCGS